MKKLFSVLTLLFSLCLTVYAHAENDSSKYWGTYEKPDMDMILTIHKDGTFEIVSQSGEVFASGNYEIDDGITLVTADEESTSMDLDENGNLYCDEIEGTFQRVGDTRQKSGNKADNYVGSYQMDELLLQVNDDNTFKITSSEEEGEVLGVYVLENNGLTLIAEDDSTGFLVLDENGNLYDSESEFLFRRLDNSKPAPVSDASADKDILKAAQSFQGYWKYEDGNCLLIDNNLWMLYDEKGWIVSGGPMLYDEGAASLKSFTSDAGGGMLRFDEQGNLREFGNILTPCKTFPFGKEGGNEHSALKGKWLHSDPDGYIYYFDGNGNYFHYFDMTFGSGPYRIDGDTVILAVYDEDGYSEARLDSESGQLFVSGDAGSYYYKAENEEVSASIKDEASIDWHYLGYWGYADGSILLIKEKLWLSYTDKGELLAFGPMKFADDKAYLMSFEGFAEADVYLDKENNLYINGIQMAYHDSFPYGKSKGQLYDFLQGEWHYSYGGNALYFDKQGNYIEHTDFGFSRGPYIFDGKNITFSSYKKGDGIGEGWLTDGGNIVREGEAGDSYSRAEANLDSVSLKGTWYYSAHENILYFNGIDHYMLKTPQGIENGLYTYDGILLQMYSFDKKTWTNIHFTGGDIYPGSDGSYYYRAEPNMFNAQLKGKWQHAVEEMFNIEFDGIGNYTMDIFGSLQIGPYEYDGEEIIVFGLEEKEDGSHLGRLDKDGRLHMKYPDDNYYIKID